MQGSSIENPNNLNADDVRSEDEIFSYLDSVCASCIETIEDLRDQNENLSKTLDEACNERDELRIKLTELEASFVDREEESLEERFELETEIELLRARVSEIVEERSRRDGALSEILESIRSSRDVLRRISDVQLEERSNFEDGLEMLLAETRSIQEMSLGLERKFVECEECWSYGNIIVYVTTILRA